MPEFDSRSWKKPFLEMLIETDKEKLTKLVHVVEVRYSFENKNWQALTTIMTNGSNCRPLASF